MRLYDLKHNLHSATGGIWIDEVTREEDAIKEALGRGDAVIVEVASGTEAVTVHALPPDDLDRFGTLSAWSAFQCSGRDTPFDSTFFRVDVEPVESVRELLQEGVTPSVNLRTGSERAFEPPPSPSRERDDDDEEGDEGDDGEAGGPVKARPGPGDEPPPPPAQVRAPRGR